MKLEGFEVKFYFILIAALLIVIVISASGCSSRDPVLDYTDTRPVHTYVPPEPVVRDTPAPAVVLAPEPEPMPEPALVSDVNPAMLELLRLFDSNLERLSGFVIGLFTVQSEEREGGAIAVVFRAVDMEIDYLGIAVHITAQVEPYFSPLPALMKAAGISDPLIVLEFLDMEGGVIYIHKFTLDTVPEVAPPLVVGPGEDPLLLFIESQKATIDLMREQMAGMGTLSVQARGTSTIACIVNITDRSISGRMTEDRINNEVLPLLRAMFADYIPTLKSMGVSDPSIIVEAYDVDGALLVSTVVR